MLLHLTCLWYLLIIVALKVKMVEQQELKSYDLLSSQSVDFHANDPRFNDMWYIVSATLIYSVFLICLTSLLKELAYSRVSDRLTYSHYV